MSTPTTPPGDAAKKSGISGKAILAIVLVALTLVFIFSNGASGSIHFLMWQFTMPVWIWFLIILVIGVVIGSLFPWFRPKKKARR